MKFVPAAAQRAHRLHAAEQAFHRGRAERDEHARLDDLDLLAQDRAGRSPFPSGVGWRLPARAGRHVGAAFQHVRDVNVVARKAHRLDDLRQQAGRPGRRTARPACPRPRPALRPQTSARASGLPAPKTTCVRDAREVRAFRANGAPTAAQRSKASGFFSSRSCGCTGGEAERRRDLAPRRESCEVASPGAAFAARSALRARSACQRFTRCAH